MKFQPDNFKMESTTVWSFEERGNWATHSGSYRGNWSPYIPRNLILRYSKKNEWVLDQFMGSGTTLIEAKLLGRNAIGIDVNEQSIKISKSNLCFPKKNAQRIMIRQGDAKKLDFIKSESIDLICTHPPYANIITYSKETSEDISLLTLDKFIIAMGFVAAESYRVLKSGKICCIMMGDIRKYGKIIPLGMKIMDIFLSNGFQSKEIIIKQQYNCRSTNFWYKKNPNFLLIAHEYIFVFEK